MSEYLGQFQSECEIFNDTYKLSESNGKLQYRGIERLAQFATIFQEEVTEVNAIFVKMAAAKTDAEKLSVMVELADWLGDMTVYCTSEALRWGLPHDEMIRVIMDSNRSKLGADGKPIYHPETGKVMKGPNYWKPEPKMLEILQKQEFEDLSTTNNIVFG